MADNMDRLLFSVGEQVNCDVPYTEALKKIKARAELERARRIKRDRTIRLLSVAASLVIVLGVGTVLITSGFFNMGADMASPEAAITARAADEPAALAEPAAPAAPLMLASYDDPTPLDSAAPMEQEPPLLGFAPDMSNDTTKENAPDCAMAGGVDGTYNSGEPRGDMFFTIGLPAKLPTPTDATDTGMGTYTLSNVTSEEVLCVIGEARLYQIDDVTINAMWRIGEKDYISITAYGFSIEEVVAIMSDMVEK